MFTTLVLLGLALSAEPAPPSAPVPASAQHSGEAPSWMVLRDKLERALQQQRFDEALVHAKAMTADPEYAHFTDAEKRDLTYLIGVLNLQLARPGAALPYLEEVTRSPDATSEQWVMLLDAYAAGEKIDDAARTMTTVVQRFPEARDALTVDFRAQFALHPGVDEEVAFGLRQALYRADWRYDHVSWVWLKLIDDLLERGRLDEARPIYGNVTEADARIQLLAMRRYDPLRPAGATTDLDSIFAAQIASDRKAASSPDASMSERSAYVQSLYALGRYDEAVAVADAAIAAPAPEADSEEAIDLNWIMDGRAYSLFALGRLDEALAQELIAVERPEYGGPNLSQAINLAWFYLRTDRLAEAKAVADPLIERDNGKYARMRVLHIRACVAHALNDSATVEAALTELRDNWKDSPSNYYDALACTGDEEAMAALILELLADPERQQYAVAWMHTYRDIGFQTDFERRISGHYDRVKARPDLVAARDQVAHGFDLPTIVGPY